MNVPVSPRILVGITGASGSIYAERLIQVLLDSVPRVYLIVTESGAAVARHELREAAADRFSLVSTIRGNVAPEWREKLRVFRNDDLFAPVASGSSAPTAMVILPCSMGSLARVATGQSTNLLERSADVVLKQKKRLIICPRETPLNSIHLRNMLTLSDAGAHILPAMPAFYQNPRTVEDMVDFVVGRVLEALDLDHQLYTPWNSRMR
jgi:4-hydroxy-3-polyprenylbenzoate decarboxylase